MTIKFNKLKMLIAALAIPLVAHSASFEYKAPVKQLFFNTSNPSTGGSSGGSSSGGSSGSGSGTGGQQNIPISISIQQHEFSGAYVGQPITAFDFKSLASVTGTNAPPVSSLGWVATQIPEGLTLSSQGILSGTPTAPYNSLLSVIAAYDSNSAGQSYIYQVNYLPAFLTDVSSLDFGAISVNTSRTMDIVVSNQSASDAISGSYVSLAPVPEFSIAATTCGTAGAPVAISASGSCSVSITFAPTSNSGTTNTSVTLSAANASSVVVPITASRTAPAVGQIAFTTPGTYSWTVPNGVTSVSVVTVGGGGGGSSGGAATNGGLSSFGSFAIATGGTGGTSSMTTRSGGIKQVGEGGGSGGSALGGGGGAGGYSGAGGNGTWAQQGYGSGPGGGVGIFGQGSNGTGGPGVSGPGGAGAGSVGSGGAGGGGSGGNGYGGNGKSGVGGSAGLPVATFTVNSTATSSNGVGIGSGAGGRGSASTSYSGGGGGGLAYTNNISVTPGSTINIEVGAGGVGASVGGNGAVRIIWPGTLRQFPSTRTADE